MTPDNRIAVCPGSYDPVTNGHLDVITRAAAMFDRVIVAVVNLPIRKGNTLFSTDERVGFVRNATAHLGNVDVEPFATLVVDFARERGAKADRQGPARDLRLRVRAGDEPAQPHAGARRRVRVPDGLGQVQFRRSSGVKELATFGGNIAEMVPDEVAAALQERLGR